MFIIENSMVGLTEYTSNDNADMYLCWMDAETQKGYNGKFNQTFKEFERFQLEQFKLQFKFWVTIIDKRTSQKVGVLRLGLDEICPDLAIWIYPQHRNKGYGTQSFKLALEYIFENYPYLEISAGCYEDNTYSLKMLRRIGFYRYPGGDVVEENSFTGNSIKQLEFRIKREQIDNIEHFSKQ